MNSRQLLSHVDYNFKKDRLELGNLTVKEKQDKRKKALDSTKRKIEEVKDYSMKIIEVILTQDDGSDQEDEEGEFPELVTQRNKFYKKLKEELGLDGGNTVLGSINTSSHNNSKDCCKEKEEEDSERH